MLRMSLRSWPPIGHAGSQERVSLWTADQNSELSGIYSVQGEHDEEENGGEEQETRSRSLRHPVQHSAHIEPGRDGLFNLFKSIPLTLKYEPGTILAEGDFVIVWSSIGM